MLKLSVFLLLPAVLLAVPSGHGTGYCRTEYDTVLTKVCATAYETRCHQQAKTKYRTEYDTKCETTSMKNCYPVPREVADQECGTAYEEVCTKNTQKSYRTDYDEQCHDTVKEVCEEIAVKTHVAVVAHGPSGLVGGRGLGRAGGISHGGIGGGRGGVRGIGGGRGGVRGIGGTRGGYGRGYGGSSYGLHSRVGREAKAKPSGYGPKCRQIKDTVCSKVPIKVPVYVEVPSCQQVPRTVCKPTYKVVLDTKCVDVPKERCAQVPRQVAFQVPFEVCEDIPMEQCQEVPKKVPRKICKQYGHAQPVAVVAAGGYGGAGHH